jgi:hypothetical protein
LAARTRRSWRRFLSVLPFGTDLVVTGDAIDAAGHRWGPVRSDTLDVEGYVVETIILIVT